MTRVAVAARWSAIAIAVAAAIDPVLSVSRLERPAVRIHSREAADVPPIAGALRDAGFQLESTEPETATVLIGRSAGSEDVPGGPEPASGREQRRAGDTVVWAIDTSPTAPNVRVARVVAPATRLPTQAVEIKVDLAGIGVAGQTTEVVLEEKGIPVAVARHQWRAGEETPQVALHYLPPGAGPTRLRVRASAAAGETSADDNAADVAIPPQRGPVRALVVDAAVTWPAVFVRRALEGEPAFAVSAIQRAARGIATRAGSPPAALTRAALAPYEVVFLGGPDALTAADLEALRWFVEERGGIAVFIPDQRPSGRYAELVGTATFERRVLETPARLAADLQASELLIPARLPAAASVLAAHDGTPVVFAARRGAGAVVFSGALDAWRYRATVPAAGSQASDEPFARFWRGVVVEHAASVPPAVDVLAAPGLVRPGDRTAITVRLRDAPAGNVMAFPAVSARVVSTTGKVDEPLRLWPTAEPGVYEGEWRAPEDGLYAVSVLAGEQRGDAMVAVASEAVQAVPADPGALALLAGATGGQVFPVSRAAALVEAMKAAHPARRVERAVRPMRSAWWVLPFAGLLCAEWAVRRKRGLP